jgi:WD40 repeat protein
MPDSNFDKAALAWAIPWDSHWVTSVAFMGASRRLAAANNEGQILIWDLPEKADAPIPAPVRRLDGHTNGITALAASPDGRRLYSSSYDRTVRVWDLEAPATGTAEIILNPRAREAAQKAKKPLPETPPITVAVQQAERVLDTHKEWVRCLVLSKDGTQLFTGDDNGLVILWEAPAMKEVRRIQGQTWLQALALSNDKQLGVTCEYWARPDERPNSIRFWDLASGKVKHDLSKQITGGYNRTQCIVTATFSPDDKQVALGVGGGDSGAKIYVVDVASGKKVREVPGLHVSAMTYLLFHPDGKHLFSCGRDTVVRIWQLSDWKPIKELGKRRGSDFDGYSWIHAVSLSADGLWLAAADMGGQVQVWSIPSSS